MYIKQVIIQGFKSYKDQTAIDPFSTRHNVVVGRNGSGKSNFFSALRFVLGDHYQHMDKEVRQSLLHEGSGQATISAYVEIIFDNSDQRFPTSKDEVVLRRTIGLKKDDYSLDKKSVTKTEVIALLGSAGFSTSNPYYIVPQGKITKLTNADNAERLRVLKEVAGIELYENRRHDSLKIIQDTNSKREKIDEMLETIYERLDELEEEKKELKQFQEQDRKRRCLAYALHSREQKEANDGLERLEETRLGHVDTSNALQQQFNDREKIITQIEKEVRDYRQREELLNLERTQMRNELEEQSRTKAHLKNMVTDMQTEADSNTETRERLETEIQELDGAITERDAELSEILPQYEEAAEREKEIRNSMAEAEAERNTLYAKQGRNRNYRNKADRDRWLNSEIRNVQKTISEQEGQARNLEAEINAAETRAEALTTEVQNAQQRLDDRRGGVKEIDTEYEEARKQRSLLEEQKKDLWREDSKLSTSIESYRSELSKCQRNLDQSCDRNTSHGLRAVERITREKGLKGVYGPLYKLFEVNERYINAVEVIAGASLFHVVVENADVASKLLDQLNRERSGRLTFMPLEQLHPVLSNYPQGDDVVPMLRKLQFDEKFEFAIRQVFGRAVICNSLEAAAGYSRSHKLNAVTLDGDRADRKGSLTGGYRDPRSSRLENIRNMKQWNAKLKEAESRQEECKRQTRKIEQDITQLRDKMLQLEDRRKRTHLSRGPLMDEITQKTREASVLKEKIAAKRTLLEDLQAHIRQLNIQLEAYQAELAAPFSKNLTAQEEARCEELTRQIEQFTTELAEASSTRLELQGQKAVLEAELTTNLKKRRNEAAVKLQALASEGENNMQLEARQRELEAVEEAMARAHERIEAIDDELNTLSSSIAESVKNLDRTRTEQVEQHKEMEAKQRVVEKHLVKRTRLLKKKDDAVKSIRDLGLLPEEAFEKYQNLPMQTLVDKLHRVNESLKKFSHVNKKAFEQYQNFTKQREDLDKRKEELDTAAESINSLIKNLDQRKDEVIQKTFDQVAQNFEEVWEKLVPAGRGRLIMEKRTDVDNEDTQEPEAEEEENSDEDEEAETRPTKRRKGKGKAKPKAKKAKTKESDSAIDQYSGVGIEVSFNSKRDEGLRMTQLSGGQKTLVALALIFAIQKCDPAPFYLFDEIDAALDAQYRTAVANMIHELSENAQFITTTFRPEMLVQADKFYGVTFTGKVSRIQVITKENAETFVENQAPAQ